ncbi:MAG: hypothetical protein CMB56_002810 [Methanobacteriota archaeon]|nr:MAG: hypothetical protein CMB56_002810 [Euryarchaeota archaeon]|tara:strand:- start:66380 stop:66919 length:540 start_codon:yes stop_codon:yes gene_type:complete
MEKIQRFIFHKGKFLPGELKPESPKLKNIKMLIHERDGFNMRRIKRLARLHPNSIWDPENADYGSLLDSIMLGFNYVTIDGNLELSELKISHALCKNAITKFTLNDSIEHIEERLNLLKDEIQRPILIIGKNPGDLQELFEKLDKKIIKKYDWYVAPSTSSESLHIKDLTIKGICKSNF